MRIISMVKFPEANALPPSKEFMDAMEQLTQDAAKAGCVMVGAEGLLPTTMGARVSLSKGKVNVMDGPFTETKELVAGYTIIRTRTREEAIAWSRRFPNPNLDDSPCHIEVRPLYELEDFGDSPTLDRFREIGIGGDSELRPQGEQS